jgi:hypothetical protein
MFQDAVSTKKKPRAGKQGFLRIQLSGGRTRGSQGTAPNIGAIWFPAQEAGQLGNVAIRRTPLPFSELQFGAAAGERHKH